MKILSASVLVLSIVSTLLISCQKENVIIEEQKITIQPNSSEGIDAILSSKNVNQNFGHSEDASIIAINDDGLLNVTRFLIKFDLSEIPENALITKAYISFYNNSDNTSSIKNIGDNYFTIKRVTSNWGENEVSWETQPSTSDLNKVTISKSYLEDQNFENIDATKLIQDLLFFEQSFGVLVKLQSESATKAVSIASSDNPNSSLHPKLEISYIIK